MVQPKKNPTHKESKIEYKTFYKKKCERVPLYELKRGDSDIYLVQKIIALRVLVPQSHLMGRAVSLLLLFLGFLSYLVLCINLA